MTFIYSGNIAFLKNARQISTGYNNVASRAVDGSTLGADYMSIERLPCAYAIHPDANNSGPSTIGYGMYGYEDYSIYSTWWRVDFGHSYVVQYVFVMGPTNYYIPYTKWTLCKYI